MVRIETNKKWNEDYYEVNNKSIGDINQHSFNFFLDRSSGNIYSEDTGHSFTVEELAEFVEYIKKENKKGKNIFRNKVLR